jgi:hypothetical protein
MKPTPTAAKRRPGRPAKQQPIVTISDEELVDDNDEDSGSVGEPATQFIENSSDEEEYSRE